ncbi:Curli production assembly/transport component CsgG [Winogradskyella eckloniae]|nr:Curli production assembly/transport component CsgG [Winogradskyella eckloniae]
MTNSSVFAQPSKSNDRFNARKYAFYDFRGANAIDLAAGSTFIDGDYTEYALESYFRLGYKCIISSHLNVNFIFNKYNIAVKDVYNQGFMSYDLNLELLLTPYTKCTPYVYAGGGYNTANSFESASTKAQAGLGIEYIVTSNIGLKLFGEYNYTFTDALDGLVEGTTDDMLLRVGLGLHIYFGGNKKKEMYQRKLKTVINSNLIIPYN